MIKKHLDLTSGRDRGRIYRVVAEGFRQAKLPRLGQASTGVVCMTLAIRMAGIAIRRRDFCSSGKIARRSSRCAGWLTRPNCPRGGCTPCMSWRDWQHLRPRTRRPAADPHPSACEHAAALAETCLGDSPALAARLKALSSDDDMRVWHTGFHTRATTALPTEPLTLIARMRCCAGGLAIIRQPMGRRMSAKLVADEALRRSPGGRSLLESLATQVGRQKNQQELAAVLRVVDSLPREDVDLCGLVLGGVNEGLQSMELESSAATRW